MLTIIDCHRPGGFPRNGVDYALPEIRFIDASGLAQTTVTVTYCGETETAVPLTEENGKRQFVPEAVGMYKIMAYVRLTLADANEWDIFHLSPRRQLYKKPRRYRSIASGFFVREIILRVS